MKEPRKYILALDQGTTSSRALVFNRSGEIKGFSQEEFPQIFSQPGWVEHDPEVLWASQLKVLQKAMKNAGISGNELSGIGITNQRETALAWDRKTGDPLFNAIVWQDRRTSSLCSELKEKGVEDLICKKTGLVLDPYFSATKWKWMLDHVPEVRRKAESNDLLLGTVDTWLMWKLTGGKLHISDVTNASRTMLMNIHTLEWDRELLDLFGIPFEAMPELRSCSEIYANTERGILHAEVPLGGMAGDQQAASFGQMCTEPWQVKCTYGTGCFILCNTGSKAVLSKNRLLTTIALQLGDSVSYAIEGSIFAGGSVIQWLRDGLGLISDSDSAESLAREVQDNGGVYMVPAFTGLGAPYWDPDARGLITGLGRESAAGHIARSALECIAYQVADVSGAMQNDAGRKISMIKVDGGASRNDLLMQFQADILNIPVLRPQNTETTAQGAAYLAGLSTGLWENLDEIKSLWKPEQEFRPSMREVTREMLLTGWKKAIERCRSGY